MAEHEAQAIEQFRRAFEALPEGPRRVLYLHRVERLDYAAIAEQLAIDVGQVEADLAEAICLIDRFIEQERREGG